MNDYTKLRHLTGYMPGKFSLYSDLTVEENLTLFAAIHQTSIRENYHLIRDIYIQLEPFKNRRAGALSGGMKQKLALSCAMIHKPQIVLLDEPTTGVDAVSRNEFWEMLKKLQVEGITIIVSTPYMDEASICNRVALMQSGKLLSVDTPAGIVAKFGNRLLAIKSNHKLKLSQDLQKYTDTATVHAFGGYFHYMDKRQTVDLVALENYLRVCGHEDIIIKEIAPSIEDCFMALMSGNE